MNTFTISAFDAKAMASQIALTDKTFYQFERVFVRVTKDSAVAMATNRFVIGSWASSNVDSDTDELHVSFTPAMAKFISGIKLAKSDRGVGITFTFDGEKLTATCNGHSFTDSGDSDSKHYSTVMGYLTNFVAADVALPQLKLNMDQLGLFGKVLDHQGKKLTQFLFDFSAPTQLNGTIRNGAIRLRQSGYPNFVGLIQPMMVKDGE